MHPIRLIAMDMDGTLLTRAAQNHVHIPPENAAVLHRAHASGVQLALVSGRMPDDASFFASDIALPMHVIGLNGSVTLDAPFGQVINEAFLPTDTAHGILTMMMEAGVDAVVFGQWDVVAMGNHPLEWAQLVLGTYFSRNGGRLSYHAQGLGVEQLLSCAGKIVALTEHDYEGLARVRDQIHLAYPQVEISSSWRNNFEVNPQGIHKGSALTALAQRLNIPMSQVMAIGDNDNDIPMLQAAGVSVAMANATPGAVAAARYTTLDNEQCGAAFAIRQHVFGE